MRNGQIIFFLCAAAGMGLCLRAPAGPVMLDIGRGTANPGQVAEVAVDFSAGGTAVSTLVLVLGYDPGKLAPFANYYEFVRTDVTGQPLEDGQGNVVKESSAVRPGAAAQAAGRLFQSETHEEGAVAVAIWGDTRSLPDGRLMTVAFQVLPGAMENEVLAINGVLESAPITVTVTEGGSSAPLFSSAAGGADAAAVAVSFNHGSIQVGCTPPDLASNVTASKDRADAVLVAWEPVSGAEYRVYRSGEPALDSAAPLGDQWVQETSFLDSTAPAAAAAGTAGCFGNTQYTPVAQYYWVKTRTVAFQCERALSGAGAEGWRSGPADQTGGGCGGGKAGTAVAAGAWPKTPAETGNAAVSGVLLLGFLWSGAQLRRRHGAEWR